MTVVTNGKGAHITYANVGVPVTNFNPDHVLVLDWNRDQPKILTGRLTGWPFVLRSGAVQSLCRTQGPSAPTPLSAYLGAPSRGDC